MLSSENMSRLTKNPPISLQLTWTATLWFVHAMHRCGTLLPSSIKGAQRKHNKAQVQMIRATESISIANLPRSARTGLQREDQKWTCEDLPGHRWCYHLVFWVKSHTCHALQLCFSCTWVWNSEALYGRGKPKSRWTRLQREGQWRACEDLRGHPPHTCHALWLWLSCTRRVNIVIHCT